MVRTRLGALVAVFVLVLAACTPSGATQSPGQTGGGSPDVSPSAGETDGGESPSATTGGDGEPVEGGTIVIALDGEIDVLDATLISDSNSSYVINQVLEGLVQLAPGSVSEVEPVLAADLPEVSEDGRTYTFEIREGITFHDGTPFNAQAVEANFDRWLNQLPEELQALAYYPGAVFEGFGETSNVESFDAPDDTTFEITLKEPRSNFLLALTLAPFYIQSPTAMEEGDANNPDPSQSEYAQRSGYVGTGPFRLEEWVRGDHLTIVKNEDYSGAQEPALLDEIVFRPFADRTAALNALQGGDVDWVQTISPVDAGALEGDDTVQIIDRGQSCNLGHLAINQQYEPVNNVQIRQAMRHALNIESYIETFYAGQARVADNWMPPAALYYKPLELPTYDPDQARALIEESGVTDLTIDFWYPSDVSRPYMPDPQGLFQAIQSDLEAVGFTINPNTATWNPDYLDAESAGEYEAWLIGWTCDWASADNFLSTAFFGYRDGEPNPEYAYDSDELDEVMSSALAATTEEEAAELWSQAQDIVATDLPTIPLVNSTPPGAASSSLRGVQGSGALNEYFNTAWIAEE